MPEELKAIRIRQKHKFFFEKVVLYVDKFGQNFLNTNIVPQKSIYSMYSTKSTAQTFLPNTTMNCVNISFITTWQAQSGVAFSISTALFWAGMPFTYRPFTYMTLAYHAIYLSCHLPNMPFTYHALYLLAFYLLVLYLYAISLQVKNA